MSRPIHIIAAFALVLAFVWDNAGSSCMEGLHRWHRDRQQAYRAGIAADTLVLSLAEYQALTIRDKREINFRGQMYDIHSATLSGDRIVLAGHFDHFDKELFKILESLLGEDSEGPNDEQQLSMFLYTGTIPHPLLLRTVEFPEEYSKYAVIGTSMVPSATRDVPTAPPDIRTEV